MDESIQYHQLFPAWQISVILCQIISHISYPDNEKAGTQTGLMYRVLK